MYIIAKITLITVRRLRFHLYNFLIVY